MRKLIKDLFLNSIDYLNKEISISGWVRNNRDQKNLGFLVVNDGTCFESIQVVYNDNTQNVDLARKIRSGSSVEVCGILVKNDNNNTIEVNASKILLLGDSPEDYPIQPKNHSREFLRENAHLRARTNLFNAVFRVRSIASFEIHKFFQENNFVYVNTPLITASDCEGAGEMFNVTTLDYQNLIEKNIKTINYEDDFFGQKASLTVSGQLEAELMALALSNVYTFGPTFRAENSNTQKHASEFWMIEPEMAFCDIYGLMDVMENMLKTVVSRLLDRCKSEFDFFDTYVEKGLINKLRSILDKKFERVTHHDAITILKNSNKKFEFEPEYGKDLQTEHEKYLTDVHFKSPVFVTNWPKDIKAFYMKLNDDNKTVRGVDLLVPGPGELCGGSQREEDYNTLINKMKEFNIDPNGLKWYLDTRKYGGCIHSGFGMGFERFLMYITGVENIRDVCLFPRTPKNIEF